MTENAIKIIHKEMDNGEYRLLSGFFRMNGFFVYNHIIRSDDMTFAFPLNEHEYRFIIVIADKKEYDGNKENDDDPWRGVKTCYGDSVVRFDPLEFNGSKSEEEEDADKERQFKIWIQALCGKDVKNHLADYERDYFLTCAEIYVQNHLRRYLTVIRSLYYNERIVSLAQRAFFNAHEAFEEKCGNYLKAVEKINSEDENYRVYFYATYFEVDIARYINETCIRLEQQLEFSTKRCVEQLKKCAGIKDEDEASHNDDLWLRTAQGSAYYLMGDLLDTDRNLWVESISAYVNAISCVCGERNSEDGAYAHMRQYSTMLFYKAGRFFERHRQNFSEAKIYYDYAHQTRKDDYRVIYKLAIVDMHFKDYCRAAMHYYDILEILKNKEKMNHLEPKEYEYLFKSYHQLYLLYNGIMKVVGKADEMFRGCKRVIALAGDETESNILYDVIYGSRPWNDYRSVDIRYLTQNRISKLGS